MELKPISLISRLALALAVFGLLAFIPTEDTPLDKLVLAVQKWSDTTSHEKVYLHTDRPYYAIGDTIWFKAYLTIGPRHQLSAKSGALYVELINTADSVEQLLKLPVLSGMAKGNLVLSTKFIEGNYRLRAYTQWMRNAGPDYFYDKVLLVKTAPKQNVFTNITYLFGKGDKKYLTAVLNYTDSLGFPLQNIPVKFNLRKSYATLYDGQGLTDARGNVAVDLKDFSDKQLKSSSIITRAELSNHEVVTKSFPIKSVASQADMQFFPEGGDMVEGYPGRVAFKALGVDGLGVDVQGVVMDDKKDTITSFATRHLGMGYFNLLPKPKHTYHASITYPDGSTKTVKLPAANPFGYTLAVYPNALKDSILVRINGAIPTEDNSRVAHLIMQSGGEVYYSATVNLKNGSASLHLPAGDLPSGIAQITLFSASGYPMNERIVFIDNNDGMALDIKADKNNYSRREKTSFAVAVKGADGKPAVGSLSVSVINEDEVPFDDDNGTSILSHLLLSSDIKGYVEKPNYYFNHAGPAVKDQLDLLMLTQGYRRFNWTDLIQNKPYDLKYLAQGLTTKISGRIEGIWGKNLAGAKVYIMNNKLGLFDTITNKDGRFNFDKLVLTDGLRFSVSGRRKNNADNVRLFLDKYSPQRMTASLNRPDMTTDFRKVARPEVDKLSEQDIAKLLQGLTKNTLLKQVNIKDQPGQSRPIKGRISQSIIFDETDAGKTIIQAVIDRKLEGIKFKQETQDRATPAGDGGATEDTPALPANIIQLSTYNAYLNKKTPMSIFINDKFLKADERYDILQWNVEDAIKLDIARMSDKYNKPALLFYTTVQYVPIIRGSDKQMPSDLIWDMTNILPKGFDNVKEFYEPKYTYTNRQLSKPQDLRTTVYWNPSVVAREGKATFSFYNNDKPGNYKVVVEGIDADGEIGRQIYRYKVAMDL